MLASLRLEEGEMVVEGQEVKSHITCVTWLTTARLYNLGLLP